MFPQSACPVKIRLVQNSPDLLQRQSQRPVQQDLLQTVYFDTSISVEDAIAIAEEEVNDFLSTYDGAL